MPEVKEGDVIVVWFSCGAASAVAAKKTLEMYGDLCQVKIVNNPIADEHSDNRRFLKDVEKWLGVEIEFATHSQFPSCSCSDVWDRERYMSGAKGAPCTRYLKKRARQQWEDRNSFQWIVMGFTSEEKHRSDRFIKYERDNLLPVLIDHGITKSMCFDMINDAGIRLPEIYLLGYPNANCIGCVKSASPTYWNHVRKMHPLVFKSRAEQSRRIGCKLVKVKGKRIFLDELPADAKGRPIKNMNFECGIFCEEKKIK